MLLLLQPDWQSQQFERVQIVWLRAQKAAVAAAGLETNNNLKAFELFGSELKMMLWLQPDWQNQQFERVQIVWLRALKAAVAAAGLAKPTI